MNETAHIALNFAILFWLVWVQLQLITQQARYRRALKAAAVDCVRVAATAIYNMRPVPAQAPGADATHFKMWLDETIREEAKRLRAAGDDWRKWGVQPYI